MAALAAAGLLDVGNGDGGEVIDVEATESTDSDVSEFMLPEPPTPG